MSPTDTTGADQVADSKLCKRCKKVKLAAEFYLDEARSGGLSTWCRQCQSERSKERRKTDPEFVARKRITAARWYDKNKEANKQRKRQWVQNNKYQHNLSIVRRIVESGDRSRYKEAARLYAVAVHGSASKHTCVRCGRKAEHWHHWTYHQKYWASVVPVCRDCHVAHHQKKLKIPLSNKDAVQGAEFK